MGRQIKTGDAEALLEASFRAADEEFGNSSNADIPAHVLSATTILFKSNTQAYREALVGCAIARILDPQIDIRLPATEHGENAFSGRSLAERVITPFMQGKSIPVSVAPYLSSIRGGARFVEGGEPRIQRDKPSFAALVNVVDYLRNHGDLECRRYLRYILRCFIELRETGNISLKRIAQPSLVQLDSLIRGLLDVKSGGRISSFLATAMFQTLSDCHNLGWKVEFQGINVADKASGAVGDITIQKNGELILGVEVTERPISQARVTLTFDQKVAPAELADYLFVTTAKPEEQAVAAARSYTAVGHEMNFVCLPKWIFCNLATIGPKCRIIFQDKMIELCQSVGVPAELKLAWNTCMERAIGLPAN